MSVDINEADGIVTICLSRAEHGNQLTPQMDALILCALADLPADIKAVILKGQGNDFCVGRVSPMPAAETRPSAADIRRTVADPVLELYGRLRNAPVPVIGLVRGQARGVGCALVAACDLVIASDDAVFSVPELDRNIPPLLVMTALFQRITPKLLYRLVLARVPLSAADALAAGLVSTVVATDKLDKAESELRQKMSSNTTNVLRAIKSHTLKSGAEYSGAETLAANLISVELAEAFRGAGSGA